MSEYTDLKEKFKELSKQRSVNTPKDLCDILDEIELCFSKYIYTDYKVEKEQLLEDISDLLQRYKNIENIIENVSASITPYSSDNLLFDVDNDEQVIPKSQYGISGEFILEKLHRESGLRDKSNTIHQLFVELIGRWIDEWDTVEQVRRFNLKFATGLWLDELASNFGIYRLTDETDEELKKRILRKRYERFTTPSLKANDVTFFTCVKNPKTQLTSKNTYLTNDYLCYATTDIEEYYENTYVCWRDILWL